MIASSEKWEKFENWNNSYLTSLVHNSTQKWIVQVFVGQAVSHFLLLIAHPFLLCGILWVKWCLIPWCFDF